MPGFRGVFPILPTPFLPDEAIDIGSFENMIDRLVGFGVDGVTILGVLGEANRLTDGERNELVAAAVQTADGRIPVVVGASHSGARATAEPAASAKHQGADAVKLPLIVFENQPGRCHPQRDLPASGTHRARRRASAGAGISPAAALQLGEHLERTFGGRVPGERLDMKE